LIVLRNNTIINVEGGSVIKAHEYTPNWPVVNEQYANVFQVTNVYNITFTGSGTIDGNGQIWWNLFNNNTLKYIRPYLLTYTNCELCLIEKLTFINSPMYNLVVDCNHTEIREITILAPGSGHLNTDGLNTFGHSIRMRNSYISTGDDNVAIHSNDTIIEHCYFGDGHGASIGSKVGWLKNITIRNIVFNNTNQGMRIKTKPGVDGLLENVLYENFVMYNVGWPICITMFYENLPDFAECPWSNETMPTPMVIRDITVRNVTIYNVKQQIGFIQCQPSSPCKNLRFIDIHAKPADTTWTCENACGYENNVDPTSCLTTC